MAATPLAAGRPRRGRAPVAANAAALVAAYALPRACTFASAVVAARVLGAAGFGGYATAAALAVVASIAATLGMQPLLVREVALEPSRAPGLMAAAHVVKLGALALMGAVLVVLALALALPPAVVTAMLMLGAAYAVGSYVENLSAYFQGVERMHVWTQASALLGLVTGVAGAALVVATRQLAWFCAAPVLGQLAALAWLLRCAPAGVRRPPRATREDVRALLRPLAGFAAAFVATTLYYRADVLLLAHWRPAAEVGVYGAAYKLLDVAQALALAGAGALLPRLARAGGRAAGRALGLALVVAVPAAGALFLLRASLVRLLFGPQYAAAAPLLGILAPAVAPLALNMVALSALVAADGIAAAAALYLLATLGTVLLNAALIPRLGATGAAAAAVLSEALLAAGMVRAVAARAGGPGREHVRAAALAGALALAAAALPDRSGGPAAAALYAVAVLVAYRMTGVLPAPARHAARAESVEEPA